MTHLEHQCDTEPHEPVRIRMVAMNDRYVTGNGTTYPKWLRQAASEVLSGDRAAMPTYTDFLKAFAADAEGYMMVHAIKDPATGEDVPIDPPLRVLVDDLHKIDAADFRNTP